MSDQAQDNRALLAESLYNHSDPEISGEFKRLIAKAHPQARAAMPEVIVREEGSKLLAQGQKLISDFEDRLKKREIADERQTWQARLLKGFKGPDGAVHRVSAEDIPEIEKFMVENDTASPEVAAFAYLTQKRVAAPTSAPDYGGIRIPGQEGTGDHFKGLMAAPDQWARTEANKMWAEFKAGRGQQYLDN